VLEDSGSYLRWLFYFRVLDRLWSRTVSLCCFGLFIFIVDIGQYVGIWVLYYVDRFMSWWHGYLRCMIYISVVMFLIVENFYTCQLCIMPKRDVYFLNIYYICVIYRFNRNRCYTKHLPSKKPTPGPWSHKGFYSLFPFPQIKVESSKIDDSQPNNGVTYENHEHKPAQPLSFILNIYHIISMQHTLIFPLELH